MPPWPWLVAAATAVIAATVGLVVIQQKTSPEHGVIGVLGNVDRNEAGNGLTLIQNAVGSTASRLAATGGGTLTVAVASGGAAQVVSTTDLAVERDGQPETDLETRDRLVARRIDDALSKAATVHPGTAGRNILSLFTTAASMAPPQGVPFDVYYFGYGLGTVDPADARIETAGDPSQVVSAIANQLPKLPGARLHLFFTAAVSPQPQPNIATANWRTAYWKHLAAAMGMTIVEVHDDSIPAAPTVGAAPAPVIPNIPDATPVPPGRPKPKPSSAPVVLAGTEFVPDSARFVDPAGAKLKLVPLALAWREHPGAYKDAVCIGRTARFGSADSARALAAERATTAAAILNADGISSVKTQGLGYDQPLPDYAPTDPHQRAVTCQLEKN